MYVYIYTYIYIYICIHLHIYIFSQKKKKNKGMCISRGKYFVILQDDMQMTQIGWNVELTLPLKLFPDIVFSVSARVAHSGDNFGRLFQTKLKSIDVFENQWYTFPKVNNKYFHSLLVKEGMQQGSRTVGPKSGTGIDLPLGGSQVTDQDLHTFWMREFSIRGPIVYNASDMRRIGYMDERDFWLGGDDLELCSRFQNQLHKVTGFKLLEFRSDLAWGGTRRKRREQSEAAKKHKKEYLTWRESQRVAWPAIVRGNYRFDVKYRATMPNKEILALHVCT
ncbi:hypothetical protein RFI_19999 [Reticulomyxa filosa]|uniref:Uncharacterized protein n=1 Tax=Reticulomyxa filosa TaxID=46433 RepID=X6MUI5_RETFI|nr:hypothetical protein RFI_19999 [Reticulomyxa filosa]|eukprot:ETO17326.1 hypothetical protein RFI_19999 [Reticulomyxa filosa]